MPEWAGGRQATLVSWAVGGGPCEVRSASGVCYHGRGGGMRALSLGPSVELSVGHDPFEGSVEIGGGRYVCESSLWGPARTAWWALIRVKGVSKRAGGTLCEFCLWRRRWRSLGGRIRVKGVPKRAGERYAIKTLSFPFLGSSPLSWPASSLIPPSACILASPYFLFPLGASLLPPFFPERDPMVLVTPSLGFPVSFIGPPVPGFSEFFGIVRFVRLLDCLALHCVALRCISVCIALSFTLHWSTIALHCFDLCCIALPGTRFAQCCLRCFTSHRHRMLFPWQCVAMHCHCIVCVPFTALHCFAFSCTYIFCL